jgi:hypothetical protein
MQEQSHWKDSHKYSQQNGVVERRLMMIQRAHAQMRAANFDDDAKFIMGRSSQQCNDMENISSNTLNKKSPRVVYR